MPLAIPSGVAADAGNAAQVAERGASQERVRHRVKRDVAVTVAGESGCSLERDAAQSERSAGAERMAVVTESQPDRRTPGERGSHPRQIVGHGHLEVSGVTGDDMDGNGTGLQQGGFIGPGRRAGGWEPLERRLEEVDPCPLRRLRGDEVGPVHGGLDPVAADPFERVRHRHHGDGRAVPCRCGRHAFDEFGTDERPRGVVDEHHAVRSDPE